MDLVCYLHPTWTPLIRPAPATRPWMDDTPGAFAYRCLPLNIANAHGWEVLSPCGFEAVWDGGSEVGSVVLRLDDDARSDHAPVSLFGQGVVTFHIEGVFRTPPGWNLWVGGSPNRPKDAIQPLTGIVETDWSPFTFTMNWRFTRAGHPVRFEAMEPIAFLFPVQRTVLEGVSPRFEPLDDDPALRERFTAWSRERDAFQARVARQPPATRSEQWQKHYYRGVDVAGEALATDHRSKLRLAPFDGRAVPGLPTPPARDAFTPRPPAALAASTPSSPEAARAALDLRKREWLLEAQERQRALSALASAVDRRPGLGAEAFLDHYYAPGRPIVLTGEMARWPALARWTPDYLKALVGAREVEFQSGRNGDPDFERNKSEHRVRGRFDAFLELITRPGSANDAYLTAYNATANAQALAPLTADLGPLPRLLAPPRPGAPEGMMWIGAAGSFTPLHHDLTNNLLAQVVGRKRIKLLPASEVGRLYNDRDVYSLITDLDDRGLDPARFARLEGARIYDIVLGPGELLFIPLGWWHQVRALDFSVTVTYTNFLWPNDAHAAYPAAPA
jgi:hypothetical protein